MSSCIQCGKEITIPFWKKLFANPDLCPDCMSAKKEKICQYLDKVREFGADNYLEKSEETELTHLKKELGLDDRDLAEVNRVIANLKIMSKNADVEKYEKKLQEFGSDRYLDSEEEQVLGELKSQLSLSDDDVFHSLYELVRLKRLTALKDGKLPVLEADIVLQKNELCHYEVAVNLIEEKSRTSYVGGSHGVSVRIMKGVSYHVGGFKGDRIVDTFNTVTDNGSLYITNKRVIFAGNKKNVTYPVNKIVNIKRFSDAIQFQKENESKPKYFTVETDSIDEICLILTNLT